MDTIVPPLISAATVATLMQLIKNSTYIPWLSRETGPLNAAVSVFLAGLTAFGLSYSTSFDAETGGFTIGFTGTIGGLIDGLAHWLGQWTAQHTIYKGLIVPAEALGEIRAVLKEAILHQRPQIKANVPPVQHDVQGVTIDGP